LCDGQAGRDESKRRSDPREEGSLVGIREANVGLLVVVSLTLIAEPIGHVVIIARRRHVPLWHSSIPHSSSARVARVLTSVAP
jgi:hypothetical protein